MGLTTDLKTEEADIEPNEEWISNWRATIKVLQGKLKGESNVEKIVQLSAEITALLNAAVQFGYMVQADDSHWDPSK
jgi:hypothetical protein